MNGIILKISNANSLTTSIENIVENENSLFIYPNPASDFIYIQKTRWDKIYVYDIFGKVVLKINGHPDPYASTKLNITSLVDGIYFVKSGLMRSKFVIKK